MPYRVRAPKASGCEIFLRDGRMKEVEGLHDLGKEIREKECRAERS